MDLIELLSMNLHQKIDHKYNAIAAARLCANVFASILDETLVYFDTFRGALLDTILAAFGTLLDALFGAGSFAAFSNLFEMFFDAGGALLFLYILCTFLAAAFFSTMTVAIYGGTSPPSGNSKFGLPIIVWFPAARTAFGMTYLLRNSHLP